MPVTRIKPADLKYATATRTDAGTSDVITASATALIVVRGFWITADANITSATLQHEDGSVVAILYASQYVFVPLCTVKGAAINKDLKLTTVGASGKCTVGVNYELVV